jgi:hypothetical protein
MKSNLKLKITSLLAFCILAVTVSNAQEGPKFGFRLGAIISKQEFKSGSITVEPKSKFGLDLALVSDLPLGDVISFGPELHWLQKGYQIDDLSGPFQDATATLNYLELPLLIKFNFGEEAKFFVMGGPSVGYLLSSNLENNGVDIEPDYDFINRLELGAHLGAGVAVGPIVIDVRYLLGLSNFANDDPLFEEIKNTGFGAGISLMF